MKIIHCCFGIEHYIDTWGYQQNLLPLYCAKKGYETLVLASNDTFPQYLKPDVIKDIKSKGNEYMNGPVRVKRGPSFFPKHIHLQVAKGLFDILEKERPNIIFFHGSLNLSLKECVRYRIKHPDMKLFVDNHGDEYNVKSNKLYRLLYFKVLLSLFHRYCQKYVDCYYGVTQGRCDFLEKYLHVSPSKIKLLPIGADVDSAHDIKESRKELRLKYGFSDEDIIIVHGGKLDPRKGTVNLIEVYRNLKKNNEKIKLVLFGKIEDPRITPLLDNDIVLYDWLSRRQTFELFKMADLAIWPIHHTTLIEDCVASGLPYLIRKTETTQHLILSDFYLKNGDRDELYSMMTKFLDDTNRATIIDNQRAIREKINYYMIVDVLVGKREIDIV